MFDGTKDVPAAKPETDALGAGRMLGAWHRVNGDLRALHQAIQGRKADAWSLFHVAAFRSGITKDNLEKGTGDAEWTRENILEALPWLSTAITEHRRKYP